MVEEVLTNSTLSRLGGLLCPLGPGVGLGGQGTKEREATLTGWFGSGSAFAPGPAGPRVHNKTKSCFTRRHQDYKRPEDKLNMKVNLSVQNDKFRFCISLNHKN